jgi:hypothetical protein
VNSASCPETPAVGLNEDGGIGLIFQWKLVAIIGNGLKSEILHPQDGDGDYHYYFFFVNVTPCIMVEIQQHFRRTRYLHLQGSERKIDAAISSNILQISLLRIMSQMMIVDSASSGDIARVGLCSSCDEPADCVAVGNYFDIRVNVCSNNQQKANYFHS